uniref:L,D-transpeptidase family protein n=1 Tax=Altererythrobacter segetis TaxID=1104773 RepID=UPI00140B7A2E|nr:L,D-transpeptidase family protein [Altererythrobacter segetis]
MPSSTRTTSCLYGVAAVAMLWMVAMFSVAAFAQEPPPQHWDRATAATLLTYIERIDSHGLAAADYEPAQLRAAIDSGDPSALERQATESFGLVAEDLAVGHVPPGQRGRYYIAPNSLDPMLVARMIDMAITAHQVSWVLDSFAPQNSEYLALRKALTGPDAADPAKRRQIEATLEHWRWFPHNPGNKYLIVNIPEFQVRLIENGQVIDSHKVIVGQVGKPTPQFSAKVTGVILNPSWHVPQSIVAESVGSLVRNRPATARSRGYTWTTAGGRLSVTQGPGPGNSLGQIKLDMPNPLTVYLHDTPSKALFDREDRTFSHGCIRTQYPFDLADKLLAKAGWDRARIDAVVASRVTTRVALDAPLPVYVVYMTAVPQPDGSVRYLKDPYKQDALIAAKLS